MASSFALLDRAGTGASAEVFRARREADGALVALKVGHAPGGSAPLAREALEAALALSPRLPELIDLGFCAVAGGSARRVDPSASRPDARPFLALRWIEGTPLSAWRGEDRVSLAAAVARDAGEALADLHMLGIAHGDLKPDNLLVGADGSAHVLDLGLACPVFRVTPEGATLRYLALTDGDLGDARARSARARPRARGDRGALAQRRDGPPRGGAHARLLRRSASW
ncbi:MAG: hypothetical protein U0359_38790 [Byssovorax sp.]